MRLSTDIGGLLGFAVGLGSTGLITIVKRARRPRVAHVARPLRLLLARPLWWLAACALGVREPYTRYEQFRDRALAMWEQWLLSEPPSSKHR